MTAKDNVAQLRGDIDAGRTHDKVAASDPAMSPLGTDDEAGGAPTSPEVVARVRAAETARAPEPESTKRRFDVTWIALILVVFCGFIAGVAWLGG